MTAAPRSRRAHSRRQNSKARAGRGSDPEQLEQTNLDRLQTVHDTLTRAVAELVNDQAWQRMLRTAALFHHYSPHNVLLITAQCPQAQAVAGYQTWKQLDRRVRKGEKGIAILAPLVTRSQTRADSAGQPIQAQPAPTRPRPRQRDGRQGATSTGAGTGTETDRDSATLRRLAGFRVVHVFDVSQTDGPPLPEPPRPALLQGQAPAGLREALAGRIQAAGYQLSFSQLPVGHPAFSGANGVTDYTVRSVTVRPDLSDAQTVKTLAHELGHVLLHGPDRRHTGLTREQAEVEAESVAYIVVAAHGLDSAAYTVPYVTGWANGNLELVQATAERVLSTARSVLSDAPPAAAFELHTAPDGGHALQRATDRTVESAVVVAGHGQQLTRTDDPSLLIDDGPDPRPGPDPSGRVDGRDLGLSTLDLPAGTSDPSASHPTASELRPSHPTASDGGALDRGGQRGQVAGPGRTDPQPGQQALFALEAGQDAPAHGLEVRQREGGLGAMNLVDPVAVTTRHLRSVYPWQVGSALPSGQDAGPVIGLDLLAGRTVFRYDPWHLYAQGIITSPNMVVLGQLGKGKSSLVKTHLHRQLLHGRAAYILDPKGEYSPLAELHGLPRLRLFPGGPERLNPLDPHPTDTPRETLRRRSATVAALAETGLGRALSPEERAGVTAALTDLPPDALLGHAAARMLEPTQAMSDPLRTSPAQLAHAVRPAALELRRLLDGDLAGLVDAPSTARLHPHGHPDERGLVLDLSAVNATPALPTVMVCAGAWLSTALTPSSTSTQRITVSTADPATVGSTNPWRTDGIHAGGVEDGGVEEAAPPVVRRRLLLVDEAWALLHLPATTAWLQGLSKLARAHGLQLITVVHRASDLSGQADTGSAAQAQARGLLADAETRVLYAQTPGERTLLSELLDLTGPEQELLTALPPHRALWRVGRHTAVVDHLLSAVERRWLVDTDRRMRGADLDTDRVTHWPEDARPHRQPPPAALPRASAGRTGRALQTAQAAR